jgi:hypothetical protein
MRQVARKLIVSVISFLVFVTNADRVSAIADDNALPATAVTVDFDAARATSGPGVCVGAVNGGPCQYALKLVPDNDVQGDIAVLELQLVRGGDANGSDAENLLAPYNWHGMQKFTFAASDLAKGPSRTLYGQQRTILLPKRKVSVEITILSAQVVQVATPGSEFPYSIDRLKLRVTLQPTK